MLVNLFKGDEYEASRPQCQAEYKIEFRRFYASKSSAFFLVSFFNVLGLFEPVAADTVGKFSAAAALSAKNRSKSLEVTDSSPPP